MILDLDLDQFAVVDVVHVPISIVVIGTVLLYRRARENLDIPDGAIVPEARLLTDAVNSQIPSTSMQCGLVIPIIMTPKKSMALSFPIVGKRVKLLISTGPPFRNYARPVRLSLSLFRRRLTTFPTVSCCRAHVSGISCYYVLSRILRFFIQVHNYLLKF